MVLVQNVFNSTTKGAEVEDQEMIDVNKDIQSKQTTANNKPLKANEENDVDYTSENEENEETSKIKEKINPKKVKDCLENNEHEKYTTFEITDERDFTPIYAAITNNILISDEMKCISKELEDLLSKKVVVISVLEELWARLLRYYKLNVSVLTLQTYNSKVRGDVENITKILKAFVLKNRNTISEYTRHVIIEKKATDCEFNINVSAADLHLFDIFEKVSLNNLEQDLPKAKTIFYDIYVSWVLCCVIAMSVHNSKYDTPEDAKKTIESILKDKIVALNTDSTNPISKKLINVVKKEKVLLVKPKKAKEIIPKEGQEAIKKLSKENKKKKATGKPQSLKNIDHVSVIEEVNTDLKSMTLSDDTESDVIAENDLPM